MSALQLLRRPAIFSAYLAPVFFIGGTLVSESAWPTYNPIVQTISELAAGDAPTRVFMTTMFFLTGVCHIITAVFAVGIGRIGRVLLGLAGIATMAVALNPLPTVAGTSLAHRLSAMAGFFLLAAWPVFGMRLRKDVPWILRPIGATAGTVILAAVCLWFLAIWSSQSIGYVGLIERIAADSESLFPALVVTWLLIARRRVARDISSEPVASIR